MKQFACVVLVGIAMIGGCAGDKNPAPDLSRAPMQPAAPPGPVSSTTAPSFQSMDETIAMVHGEPITMRQLIDPLIESRGLTTLVGLVQLELARQNAENFRVKVTNDDLKAERELWLENKFKDQDDPKLLEALDDAVAGQSSRDPQVVRKNVAKELELREQLKVEREDLLKQLLQRGNVDPGEFELARKVDAYLRKVLEQEWQGKITEDDLRNAFGQMYGERVEVEYIQLSNMQEVNVAKRRLADGDSFELVARDMSLDRKTAPRGGRLDPFSREANIPPSFKETAFALKDGQISDVVQTGSACNLIKRLQLMPPQAVSFEDVIGPDGKVRMKGQRANVYRTLHSKLIDAGMAGLREQLGAQVQKELRIINPALQRQYKALIERQERAAKKAQEELDKTQKLQELVKPGPTTRQAPETQPSPAPAPAIGARPPATRPGSTAHPFVLPRLELPKTQPSDASEVNK